MAKNKMFFFADYDGFRRVSHPLQFAAVPAAAMNQGDFSAYGFPIANPLTGAVAPGGVIPASQYSPIAGAVLAATPTAMFMRRRSRVLQASI